MKRGVNKFSSLLLGVVLVLQSCNFIERTLGRDGYVYANSTFAKIDAHYKIIQAPTREILAELKSFGSEGHKISKGTGTVIQISIYKTGGGHNERTDKLSLYLKSPDIDPGKFHIGDDGVLGFYTKGPISNAHLNNFGHVSSGEIMVKKLNDEFLVTYNVSGKFYDLITTNGGYRGEFHEEGEVIIGKVD